MKITVPEFTITLPGPSMWRWAFLPIVALTLALTVTWGGGATAQESGFGQDSEPGIAGLVGPNVDFNLIAPAPGEGDLCATIVDDKKCLVSPGETFPLLVVLDKPVGYAFDEYSISLTYSGGLTRVENPDECAVGPFPLSSVETEDVNPGSQSVYILNCDDFFSTVLYEGSLAIIDFACPPVKSKETITIQYGFDFTHLIANFGLSKATELSPGGLPYSETIIINCDNYYPWDVHGPNQSADLDGIVDLANDILGTITHFCPSITFDCSKANLP